MNCFSRWRRKSKQHSNCSQATNDNNNSTLSVEEDSEIGQ
jgi:hypothetical protein